MKINQFHSLLIDHLLAGQWVDDAMQHRLLNLLKLPPDSKLVSDIVAALCARFPVAPPPLRSELGVFLAGQSKALRAISRRLKARKPEHSRSMARLSCAMWVAPPPSVMQPNTRIPRTETLPALTTPRELARWLDVSLKQLDWLADVSGRERQRDTERFRRYRYRWIDKGCGRKRLIEHPKPILKGIQRRILTEILNPIPPHTASHAFSTGRSPLTCAEEHVGQRVVLSIDLCEFFPSILLERVQATFRWLGYPEAVARLLTGLCTNATSAEVVRMAHPVETWHPISLRFGRRHLPQGAPTSPALANLCAYRLDCRLQGLARASGAHYSRYADDLIFSGDASFERRLGRFRVVVGAIALNEGFKIQHRKTKVMRCGKQQSILGLVVNQKPNIDRREFDALKALLFNCARNGPESQNREGHLNFRQHLTGRIAWVRSIHAERGAQLDRLFHRIVWGPPTE